MPRAAEQAIRAVSISGRGIAANCCAHLLQGAGLPIARLPSRRAPVPAILLSDPALALLRDVFGRPALFAGRPRITHRVVAWGAGEPARVAHDAIVLSEQDLDLALGHADPATMAEPTDFAIHTARPFPGGECLAFGSRRASAAQVTLAHDGDRSACWIEAVAQGWLFLIPTADDQAWLLSVGGTPDTLLGESRHMAGRIGQLGDVTAGFETAPRMLTALQGPDWLACGTAAIAFDPICGDGTAQAIREAIMACAVIGAVREGGDREALRIHFESMMIGAMRRHLRLCAQFYASGGQGEWWQAQLAGLAEGFDWCTRRLATMPEPRYELHGFRLVLREMAA